MDPVSGFDVFLKSCGITSHLADVGTDLKTGVEFILRGDLAWGILTIVFIALSMLIGALFIFCFDKDNSYRVCYLIFFPFVPFGTLVWNWKKTWDAYRRGECVDLGSKNVQNASIAKLSEALTEALPQACIGSHVVAQTLYVPGVEGTVETYQWVSLCLSIGSLALAIATNDAWEIEYKGKKALVFILLLPVISSRLIIWATMGTIVHSAMFLVPLGSEIIGVFVIACLPIGKKGFPIAHSLINVGFGIGCIFISTVPQAITITALVVAIIAAPIQAWAIKKVMD